MSTTTNTITLLPHASNEDDIRTYAYHLYEQSGHIAGRDLDNWLEAQACLAANIPQVQCNTRLHHHLRTRSDREATAGPATAAKPRRTSPSRPSLAPAASRK